MNSVVTPISEHHSNLCGLQFLFFCRHNVEERRDDQVDKPEQTTRNKITFHVLHSQGPICCVVMQLFSTYPNVKTVYLIRFTLYNTH